VVPSDLIFDFFGTLVGYTPGPFRDEPFLASHRILKEHGFAVEYDEFVRGFTSVSDRLEAAARATRVEYHMDDVGRAFFRECFDTDVSDAVLGPFIETFIGEWNRGTVFLPSIAPFLERLAGRYRLSIISNTHYPALIHRNLEAMGVAGAFTRVVTSIEHGHRKPDPRIFRGALKELAIAPMDAVYIGDTFEDDYRGATGAGLRAILVDPARRWQGVIADRVDALFDIEALLA
jgi:putative hydrolase of the HAD superfamily